MPKKKQRSEEAAAAQQQDADDAEDENEADQPLRADPVPDAERAVVYYRSLVRGEKVILKGRRKAIGSYVEWAHVLATDIKKGPQFMQQALLDSAPYRESPICKQHPGVGNACLLAPLPAARPGTQPLVMEIAQLLVAAVDHFQYGLLGWPQHMAISECKQFLLVVVYDPTPPALDNAVWAAVSNGSVWEVAKLPAQYRLAAMEERYPSYLDVVAHTAGIAAKLDPAFTVEDLPDGRCSVTGDFDPLQDSAADSQGRWQGELSDTDDDGSEEVPTAEVAWITATYKDHDPETALKATYKDDDLTS